jgi:serine/threonine protein kinase
MYLTALNISSLEESLPMTDTAHASKLPGSTTSLEFSRCYEHSNGQVKMTEPENCAIFVSDSIHPTLVVETGTDVVEISLDNKRAYLCSGRDRNSAEKRAFALQSWPSGKTIWTFSCPSANIAQSWLDALEAVGCIMTNLVKHCNVESMTPIGSGSASKIIRATMTSRVPGEPEKDVVLKIAKPGSEDQLMNEVMQVQYLRRHTALIGNHIANTRGLFELRDEGALTVALAFDFMPGGDLAAQLPPGGMAEADARGLFRQLLSTLAEFAELGMVHRDIKPENILVDEGPVGTPRAVLIDFGLATLLDDEEQIARRCGTPGFIAPEILRSKDPMASCKSDCFSLGATLYFAVTGEFPFGTGSHRELLHRNLQGFQGDLSGLSVELADLVTRLVKSDHTERLSAQEALAHSWFKERTA